MLEYLIITIIGCFCGSLTGITPGIHPNTLIFVSIPVFLSTSVFLPFYIAFIAGMVVSHSFHNFLPSIALGVPEAESALAALPGARMASEGKGHEAFLLSLEGGVKSIAFLTILSPLLFLGLRTVYGVLETLMFYLLLFIIFFIVLYSGKIISSVSVVVLTGLLGLLVFEAPVNQSYVLIPVFSGLFAMPSIAKGIGSKIDIPEQEVAELPVTGYEGSIVGGLAGLLAGTFPGLGGATSTSFLSPMIESEREFIASMGAVNTSDAMISFLSLYLIESARSGPAVALSYISTTGFPQILFAIGVSLFSVLVSVVLALKVSPLFFRYLNQVPLGKIYFVSAISIVGVTFFFTGFMGILILSTSSVIGYAAYVRNLRKSCMAVLIVPAMQFYASGIMF